jgi:exo-beta-1,3-glucanase (GH17 family)
VYTKDQWLNTYRTAAESATAAYQQSYSAQEQPAKSSADSYWTWSEQYQKYYHNNEDGSCEWGEEKEATLKESRKGKGK